VGYQHHDCRRTNAPHVEHVALDPEATFFTPVEASTHFE